VLLADDTGWDEKDGSLAAQTASEIAKRVVDPSVVCQPTVEEPEDGVDRTRPPPGVGLYCGLDKPQTHVTTRLTNLARDPRRDGGDRVPV
jgi:hypothetical protein